MWRKAWLESRWRFAICMALLVLISAADVFQADLNMPRMGILPNEFNKYVWKMYFTRFQLLWILSTLVLSMGGLVSERATGSSDFSLSLPVSRRRWNAVRGGMAAAQVFLLAMAPVAVVPLVAGAIGRSYPMLEAANFSLVIFLTGLFVLALGLVYSSCFAGQYASVALGIATVFALIVFVNPVAGRYPFSEHESGTRVELEPNVLSGGRSLAGGGGSKPDVVSDRSLGGFYADHREAGFLSLESCSE